MSHSLQAFIALAITLGLSFTIGVRTFQSRPSKRSALMSYFWGGRDLKSGDMAQLSLSTSFSLNGVLYQTWLGYQVGIASLWLQVAWCLSFVLLAPRVGRLRSISETGTLHGVIGDRFGLAAERAAAAASLIGFTILIGWELAVFLSLIGQLRSSAVLSIGLTAILTFSVALMVATYTSGGGLRGNLTANRAQNAVAVLAFAILIAVAIFSVKTPWSGGSGTAFGDWDSHFRLLASLGVGGLITNLLFSAAWQFVDMSNWQNLSAVSSDQKTLRRSLFLSAVWVFLFPGVAGTFLGMALRAAPNLTADNIIPHLVSKTMESPFVGIVVFSGLVAAMLSTIDGLLLAVGQAIVWDLTSKQEVAKTLSFWSQERGGESHTSDEEAEMSRLEHRLLRRSRNSVVAVAVIGASVVLWLSRGPGGLSLFDLVYVVVLSQMTLLPVVISILFELRTFGNARLSIVGGWLVGATMLAIGLIRHDPSLQTWSPAVALLVAVVGLAPWKPKRLDRSAS